MAEQASESPFRSEVIRVYIGPDRQLYTIHRDVICAKSPFFEKCLSSGLSESAKGKAELPNDLPAAFDEVLKWVYSRSVTLPLELPEHEQADVVLRLVHTYVLADKLCMEALCNELVDTVKACHRDYLTTPNFLSPFRDSVLSDCGLRTYLIRQLAHDILGLPDRQAKCKSGDRSLENFLEQGGSEAWEVVKKMRELHRGYLGEDVRKVDPVKKDLDCIYHRHRDTKPCETIAKGGKKTSAKRKRAHGDKA